MKRLTDPEEMAELARLYDIYGELLKDGHREMFEEYIYENYSLSEISASRDITRQAVYDVINRSREKLRGYEKRLRLLEKAAAIESYVTDIESLCEKNSLSRDNLIPILDAIRSKL